MDETKGETDDREMVENRTEEDERENTKDPGADSYPSLSRVGMGERGRLKARLISAQQSLYL